MKFNLSEVNSLLSQGRLKGNEILYTKPSLVFMAKKVKEEVQADVIRRLEKTGKFTESEIKNIVQ